IKLYISQYLKEINLLDGERTYRLFADYLTPLTMTADNRIQHVKQANADYWSLQLVQEYYTLPDVNQFIQLNFLEREMASHITVLASFQLQLTFAKSLPNILTESSLCFKLNCVPAINLFVRQSEKQPFNQNSFDIKTASNEGFYQLSGIRSVQEDGKNNQPRKPLNYLPVSQFQARR